MWFGADLPPRRPHRRGPSPSRGLPRRRRRRPVPARPARPGDASRGHGPGRAAGERHGRHRRPVARRARRRRRPSPVAGRRAVPRRRRHAQDAHRPLPRRRARRARRDGRRGRVADQGAARHEHRRRRSAAASSRRPTAAASRTSPRAPARRSCSSTAGSTRGSSWIGVTALLRDTFTCVMLDQRGHGASDWGGGPQLGRATDDLLFVIDRLGPVHAVVGHSYGALVALEAARRRRQSRSHGSPCTSRRCRSAARSWTATGWTGSRRRWRRATSKPRCGCTSSRRSAACRRPRPTRSPPTRCCARPSPTWSCRHRRSRRRLETVIVPRRRRAVPQDRGADAAAPRAATASTSRSARRSTRSTRSIPDSEVAVLDGQTHMATMFAPHLVADALGPFLTMT